MIEVENLTYRYEKSDTETLSSVSLSVPGGEFLLLVGRNGAGKTTLVRQFNGLLTPDSGRVSVNGTPVADDPVAARAAVGMVFQTPRDCFVAPTVAEDVAFGPENLRLGRTEIERRVDAALTAVGMADRHDDELEQLSGGEQARVAIAGALAMEPDHLVLDEPLAGLDLPARTSLIERLERLQDSGTGIVLATHDLRDVFEVADRIVVLADGRVVRDASPTEDVSDLAEYGVRPPA